LSLSLTIKLHYASVLASGFASLLLEISMAEATDRKLTKSPEQCKWKGGQTF